MKRWLGVFWLIFRRELVPASDGKLSVYKLLVFYVPIVGMMVLLFVIAFAGLCLLGFSQDIADRLHEFKTSPSIGIFGQLINDNKLFQQCAGKQPPLDKSNAECLNLWTTVRVQDIFPSPPPSLPDNYQIFRRVDPFDWVTLSVKHADGSSDIYDGMGLPGNSADHLFAQELQKRLKQSGITRTDGIIASEAGMKLLDYLSPDTYPVALSAKLRADKQEYVPLSLRGVVRLPYLFLFAVTTLQERALEDASYYYIPTKEFNIRFSGLSDQEAQVELTRLTKAIQEATQEKPFLPATTQVSELVLDGGTPKVMITLPQELPLAQVMQKFETANLLTHEQEFFLENKPDDATTYSSAMFYLNFEGLPNDFIWEKDQIYAIEKFMGDNDVPAKGEITDLLTEIFMAQQILASLQRFFNLGLFWMLLIVCIFFAIVLHTRIHQIGTKRMLGYPDWFITVVLMTVGFVVVMLAFLSAVITLTLLYHPVNVEVSIGNWSVVWLFLKILGGTELGFLIPTLYYLYALQPAEMLSFRS